jgi:hypothetical protein
LKVLKAFTAYICAVLLACAAATPPAASAQELTGTFVRTKFDGDMPTLPASRLGANEPLANVPRPESDVIPPDPAQDIEIAPKHIDWTRTSEQSFFFLGVQHSVRLVQKKTRRELSGKFFEEWVNSVDGLGGWGDGDSILTNYVGHPMMGAISGWILIQNDPGGIGQEFDVHSREYWNSRLRAMGWAAFYSTQFELGPISEATIGHVGKKRGTAGAVDLVMTPVGGFGWIVSEDAVDKHFIRKWEEGRSDGLKRAIRIIFNPNRSVANVLRLKKPWYRDTRPMSWDK